MFARSPSPARDRLASTRPDRRRAQGRGRNARGIPAKLAGFLGKSGATPNPEPGILWNFEKFLIDRQGKVIARFSPEVVPDDPAIVAAIEAALAN